MNRELASLQIITELTIHILTGPYDEKLLDQMSEVGVLAGSILALEDRVCSDIPVTQEELELMAMRNDWTPLHEHFPVLISNHFYATQTSYKQQ